MKLSAALSILLATAAVASPAPDPVPNVEVPEVTAKPDAMAVRDALAAAACHPNKTCLSDASKVPHCAVRDFFRASSWEMEIQPEDLASVPQPKHFIS